MASLRKGTATVAPEWEVKAKRELAIWRQHQKIARAIAQADIIVQCATKRGLAVDQLKHHDFAKAALESPTYSIVRQEAEAQMEKWEEDMAAVENVVHASFLIEAAKEAGIDVEKVRQCPFFIPPATKQQASQATFPCRDSLALEASMWMDEDDGKDSLQGEKPSLQESDQGQSQSPLF